MRRNAQRCKGGKNRKRRLVAFGAVSPYNIFISGAPGNQNLRR